MADFDEIEHPQKRAFLCAFVETGRKARAAKAAGIARTMHYHWMKQEGKEGDRYREAFALAEDLAADNLEDEAVRRAVEGVRRVKFYKGEPIRIPLTDGHGNPRLHPETGEPMSVVYVEHDYSDTDLIFLLKGLRPKKYRDRYDARIEVTDKTDEQRNQRALARRLDALDRLVESRRGVADPGGNGSANRPGGNGEGGSIVST
jgi:hypothetical protein